MTRPMVSTSPKLLAVPGLMLLLAGCSRPLELAAQQTNAQSTQVVIVSAAGKLATPPRGGGPVVPATPTFSQDFSAILTPLALTPIGGTTPSPGATSPTPELR